MIKCVHQTELVINLCHRSSMIVVYCNNNTITVTEYYNICVQIYGKMILLYFCSEKKLISYVGLHNPVEKLIP
jgi:hypothetical protein